MKTTIQELATNETGAVLVMALVALVVGALLLTPLLGLMSTGLMGGQVYEEQMHELYAADAGVDDALWRLPLEAHSLEWDETPDPNRHTYSYSLHGDVNDKAVEVTIFRKLKDEGESECGKRWLTAYEFRIVSIATCPHTKSSTTVVSTVEATWNAHREQEPEEPGSGGEGEPYEPGQGSVSEGTWIVEDGGTIDGSVSGTAIVYGEGNLTVEGSIQNYGEVYVEGNLTVDGNVENYANVYVKGDLTMTGNLRPGNIENAVTVCVGGNLFLQKCSENDVEVYVEGNLEAYGIENQPKICVEGTITVTKIEDQPTVCAGGGLWAGEIEGSPDIYAPGHQPFPDCPMCCWQEKDESECRICCECPLDFFAPGAGGGPPEEPGDPEPDHWVSPWEPETYLINPDSG